MTSLTDESFFLFSTYADRIRSLLVRIPHTKVAPLTFSITRSEPTLFSSMNSAANCTVSVGLMEKMRSAGTIKVCTSACDMLQKAGAGWLGPGLLDLLRDVRRHDGRGFLRGEAEQMPLFERSFVLQIRTGISWDLQLASLCD